MSQEQRISNLEKQVQTLKKEVEQNQHRIRLLNQIIDPTRKPFTYHAIEGDLTEKQLKQILDLMQKIRKEIQQGKTPMDHHLFEQEIYKIAPQHKGNYHYAEGIVSTLNQEDKFTQVYNHMKQSGMNI